MQGHALEHSAHCGGGLWLERAMTLSLCLKYNRAIWRAHLAHQMRLDQQSAVSQNAVSRGHLQRRHSYFLSHRKRSDRRRLPVVYCTQESGRLAAQIDTCARSKSEPLHVLVHRFVADQEAELDRADVTRFRQSVSDCKHAIRMTIVNQPAGDSDRTHLTIDLVIWLDQPLFNRGRVSNYFERRTWLVDILQRSVRARFGGIRGRLIGIKGGRIGQRQDLARVRLDLITLKGPPPSIPLKINFPRLAANLIVIVLLDAAQSNLIGSDKPEYVRRQRIVRIVTLRLFARIHAVEI